MRTMLLSFKPKWYNLIKDGSKIFEYRRTFPDEEIIAYMYVSSPMKQIVGKIHLGRKIDINTWKEKYKDDGEVSERIDYYLENYPKLFEFIETNASEIGKLKVNSFDKISKEDICRQEY